MDNLVSEKFASYPASVQKEMHVLRNLILKTAEAEQITDIVECLKWGEPAFTSRFGSAVRIDDWTNKDPQNFFMYFHCKTKLVETFREIYPDLFEFVGNRAIRFTCGAKLPKTQLQHCIALSLNYHKVKHLPLLGA